ncbi:putative adhesin [Streptomyces canus]|uniref:putative adhesin n=1 Tax=Streptomyces canus TaxID=58343 RepID=UPI003805ECD0
MIRDGKDSECIAKENWLCAQLNSLFPGDGLNILGTPRNVTVTGETRLSELLMPNMGPVHWAACRSLF